MSKLANLQPKKAQNKEEKFLAAEMAQDWAEPVGKVTRGKKPRSGGSIRWGFEGGQMPLWQRNPKFGFKNTNFRTRYEIINLETLAQFDGEVTPETLQTAGLVKKGEPVKILGRGELAKSLNVKAHKLSASAKEAIEKAGGSVEVLEFSRKRAPKDKTTN